MITELLQENSIVYNKKKSETNIEMNTTRKLNTWHPLSNIWDIVIWGK